MKLAKQSKIKGNITKEKNGEEQTFICQKCWVYPISNNLVQGST
jgi:hypothetical protein